MSSSSGGPGDNNYDRAAKTARLQKILEDYANLKKQNAIMNKLLGEGQKHKAEAEEALAAKEMQMRTLKEENELIAFNNRGLQKRCELLQDELREAQQRASSGGGWFGSGAKQELAQKKEELVVVQRELEAKISENEHIHMQMFDLKKHSQQSVQIMEQKLAAMKKQAMQVEEALQESTSAHERETSQLSDAKEALAITLSQAEADLNRTKRILDERETQMKSVLAEYTQEIERSRSLISRKLPFDDSKVPSFNRFNLLPHDRPYILYYVEVVGNLLACVTQCLQLARSYFGKLSARLQRTLIEHDPASPIALAAQQSIASLSESGQVLPVLITSLTEFYDQWRLSTQSPVTSKTSFIPHQLAFFGNLQRLVRHYACFA